MGKNYTLSLDSEIVDQVKGYTKNLSETVTKALQEIVKEGERKRLLSSLEKYTRSSQERRSRLGIFSDSHRKFG